MTSVTISPQARIAALVGVLVIALGGSAFFVLHGSSQPQTLTTTTPVHPKPPVHHVVRPVVNPLFPTPLRHALERSAFVVVGFYNPRFPISSATITEARAGAAEMGVGFLAVNVLDDKVAGPLTALLPSGEILPNPGFAIYKRPGPIVYRTDGYLAREGVVQAVRGATR